MPVSRLRLRLAGGFALILGVTLGLFVSAGLWQQWQQSRDRLDIRLESVAIAVDHALVLELRDAPGSSLREAAREVVRRWPHESDAFAVLDSAGTPLAVIDRLELARRALDAAREPGAERFDLARDGEDGRAIRHHAVLASAGGTHGPVEIVVFDSTEGIERDIEALTGTILVAAPVLILLSLVGGYLLAGRALRPMQRLGLAIDAIAPDDPAARLPAPAENDEIGVIADRVNTLLARVEAFRLRHQRFVREAAHQIRTPLTLVLGEASHAMGATSTDQQSARLALGRVHRAAEQMRRRVDELMLFAEADSGTSFARDDMVELDALALECTDLMRGRADALGRTLSLVDVAAVTVRANAALLREALLEMLENACRHGGADAAVTVGTEASDHEAHLVVGSTLAPEGTTSVAGSGLGVAILDWIAAGHGGAFTRRVIGRRYEARLSLPIDPSSPSLLKDPT